VRAVLEGNAFHLRRLLEDRISGHWPGGGVTAAVACGGLARSALWMQLFADVTGITLRVPAVIESGVLGAAILGGVAAGVLSREMAAQQMVHQGIAYVPDAVRMLRYDALYADYCALDDLLAPWFRAGGAGHISP
jgi:sugar (pentulose or hexulose) kinase